MYYDIHTGCNLSVYAPNPPGQGLSLPHVQGCSGSQQKPLDPDFRNFAQGRAFIRHSTCLKAAWRTWSHKKESQKEGLQQWPLTPEPESPAEHMGETEGPGALCACLAALGTQTALSCGCQTAPVPGCLKAQLRPPVLLKGNLIPLKLFNISQDWWNSHSLKFGCEVSDEGCSLQTTLRSPCCWYYHKNKQKCRFLFQLHRAAGLTN